MNMLQGDKRIYELSVFRLSPQILYLVAASSFNYFVPLDLISVLAIQLGVFALSVIAISFFLKPKFINIKKINMTPERWKTILGNIKDNFAVEENDTTQAPGFSRR